MARTYDSHEIIRIIEADGWTKVAQKGSHVHFKHPTKPGRVAVPHPTRTLPRGTSASIRRQAGIKPPG